MISFDLPKGLVAQSPAVPRDHARLLVYERNTRKIVDDYFYNLLSYLPDPTCVVVNNSKVEHCRMLFDGGKKEIFVLEKANDKTVCALVRPGKVFKLGKTLELEGGISAEVTAVDEDGIRTIVFSEKLDHPKLVAAQHVPLPPYIAQNDELAQEYQTIYAKDLGSKAAPTAGLHLTPGLIDKIKSQRDWAEVTLHVGLGTFAPLTDAQLASGRLHQEEYEIDQATAKKLSQAPHVTAVGTTSVRTLESAVGCHPVLDTGSSNLKIPAGVYARPRSGTGMTASEPIKGSTDILIQPGYKFKHVNSLITNFHLPGTSLLLLVAAFVGSEEELQRIYNHAVEQKYRFYSFGDAMLVV